MGELTRVGGVGELPAAVQVADVIPAAHYAHGKTGVLSSGVRSFVERKEKFSDLRM